MSKGKGWFNFFIALAIAGLIWAICEREKRIEAETKLKRKDEDYLQLLSKHLSTQKSLPKEIQTQLNHLMEDYAGVQDDVAIELKTIIDLLHSKKDEIAIEKLTKVVEHLLKEKYIAEGKAKDKRSCPKLFKLLEQAFEFKWINKHEYNISFILREQRNDEAHELAVKFPTNWKYIAFLGGIELIYNLKGIKRNG